MSVPPATQVPARHESSISHGLPSLQAVPSAAAVGFEHAPDVGSQVPCTWHWSEEAHATTPAYEQTPLRQVVLKWHRLPSVQDVPSVAATFEHDPLVLQVSVVQGFPSSH